MNLGQTFRSLKSKNFSVYFWGYLPSVAGTFMQNLALSWYVYRTTDSADLLVQAQFALLAPVALLTLLGGRIADRFNPRNVLLVTQTVALIQSLAVCLLAATNGLAPWNIMLLSAVAGSCLAFEIPARGALVPLLVSSDEMANAYSLNSLVFYSGVTSGRALAAVCVVVLGEAGCFALNAASFVIEILALAMLKPASRPIPPPQSRSITAGIKFVISNQIILQVVALIGVFGFFGMQFQAIMPIVAKDVLAGGASALALLLGAVGAGQICGSILLSHKANKSYLAERIGTVFLGLAIALGLLALSSSIVVSTALLAVVGFCIPICVSGGHSLAQLHATAEIRGRITSIYFLVFLGTEPLGCLLAGAETNWFGVSMTLLFSAAACATAGLAYCALRRPVVGAPVVGAPSARPSPPPR